MGVAGAAASVAKAAPRDEHAEPEHGGEKRSLHRVQVLSTYERNPWGRRILRSHAAS